MRLTDTELLSRGCEAEVTGVWGMGTTMVRKCYSNRKARDYAHATQCRLAAFNLAPPVFNTGEGERGNTTQFWYTCGRADISRESTGEQRYMLAEEVFDKLKLIFADPHRYNVGWYKDRLVVLDCGSISFCEGKNKAAFRAHWRRHLSFMSDPSRPQALGLIEVEAEERAMAELA